LRFHSLMIVILVQFSANCFSAEQPTSTPPPGATFQKVETLSSLPLLFEANRGQAETEVKYLFRSSSYTLFFTPGEAVVASPGASPGSGPAVRMQFVGENPTVRLEGLNSSSASVNYFDGNQRDAWLSGIPTYSKVAY